MKDKKQVREKYESSTFVEKERIRSNKEKARKSIGKGWKEGAQVRLLCLGHLQV